MKSEPTIFIVDDDERLRRSICRLIVLVGYRAKACATALEFLEECSTTSRGCAILDVRLSNTNGLDLLEQLPAQGITIPAIVLTAYGDIPMAVRALKAGAVDFLEKPVSNQILVDAVHQAVAVDAQRWQEQVERVNAAIRSGRLTPREREVMDLVVAGLANKRTAAELGCSCKTVEVHRACVMEKMCADSVPSLVRMAVLLHGVFGTHSGASRQLPLRRQHMGADLKGPQQVIV